MADYAASCIIGEALIWFEGLDEEVQGEWPMLRAALLQKYPLGTT